MSATFSKARLRFAALFACAFALHANEANAGDASTNRVPYEAAMRCYVANGVASDDNRDAGNTADAAVFKEKAREAFGIAADLGKVMGFSREQINQDFAAAQDRELPKLIKDTAYFERTMRYCKQLGLD